MTRGAFYVEGGGLRGCCAARESPPTSFLCQPVGLVFNDSPCCQVNEELRGGAVVASESEATVHESVLT